MASRATKSGAEPRTSAISQRRLLFWLLPASTAMVAIFQGIQQILLPGQIEAIDPANKIGNLALITAASAVMAVVGLLAGGAISDRTTGRWGRRTPSLVFGAIASALFTVVMGGTTSLMILLIVAPALWFSANYYQGALTAILPERVAIEHRGIASSVIALGIPLGVLVGVNFAAHTERLVAYSGLGGFLVLATAGLVLFAREAPAHRPIADAVTVKPRPIERLAGFFLGFRSRDFTLAFVARALMFFAIFSITGYTYYILQDHIGLANLPGHNIQYAVSILVSLQMLACIASTVLSGWLTDRWNRPKLFVGISSIGIAVVLPLPLFSPSWAAMVVTQTGVGLFAGAYMAIDLALMSLVLPDPETEGRDMAILSVATSGPQIFSPMIAAALISQLGYAALFGFGAIMALGAGVAVLFIRNVR